MIEVYKNNMIEGLKDLASYEFQKVAWFENNLGLWSSFEEDVEAIFEDSGFNYVLNAGEIVFGKIADMQLKELESLCDAIGYDWGKNSKDLLESNEMKIIREMAKKCLKLIYDSDGSESTVKVTDSGALFMDISFSDRDNL